MPQAQSQPLLPDDMQPVHLSPLFVSLSFILTHCLEIVPFCGQDTFFSVSTAAAAALLTEEIQGQ